MNQVVEMEETSFIGGDACTVAVTRESPISAVSMAPPRSAAETETETETETQDGPFSGDEANAVVVELDDADATSSASRFTAQSATVRL